MSAFKWFALGNGHWLAGLCVLSLSPEAILPHYWLALAVCQQCTSIQSFPSISILLAHDGF